MFGRCAPGSLTTSSGSLFRTDMLLPSLFAGGGFVSFAELDPNLKKRLRLESSLGTASGKGWV